MSYVADIAASVVRYEPDDRTALRDFQRRYFATARQSDDAFFDWLFEGNPCRDPAGAALWLCKRDGEIVGQIGALPILLKVGDTERRAHWLVDWMVHPQWRLRGVAPALLSALTAEAKLLAAVGVDGEPGRALQRAGWSGVGELVLFVRPLDFERCAAIARLPALLTKIVPGSLVSGSAGVLRSALGTLRRLSLERIGAFDERAERVWRACSPEYAVLTKRDLRYLAWRYDEGPHAPLFERYYLTRGGEAIGYAVVRTTTWRGARIGRVVDYLCPRHAVSAMYAHLVDALRGSGAAAVFFEQWHPGTAGCLRALGCFRARASHRFMFSDLADGGPGITTLSRAENWLLTPGDADFDQVLVDTESADPEPVPSARLAPAIRS